MSCGTSCIKSPWKWWILIRISSSHSFTSDFDFPVCLIISRIAAFRSALCSYLSPCTGKVPGGLPPGPGFANGPKSGTPRENLISVPGGRPIFAACASERRNGESPTAPVHVPRSGTPGPCHLGGGDHGFAAGSSGFGFAAGSCGRCGGAGRAFILLPTCSLLRMTRTSFEAAPAGGLMRAITRPRRAVR